VSRSDGRRFPNRPLVGVGAVVFDAGGERVLLVQRGAPPAQGQWTFPGGLVEVGEPLHDACVRELAEETGIQAELADLALVVERIIGGAPGRPEYHFVIIDFWGRAAAGAEPTASSDARQAAWVALSEVRQLPTTRGVPEAVERALALAEGRDPGMPLLG